MDIATRAKKTFAEHLGVDLGQVTDTASFIDNLGADSLDFIELIMAAEDEFDIKISDDDAEHVTTVGDAIALITKRVSGEA